MHITLLHDLIRRDEKLLIEALTKHPCVNLQLLDSRRLSFNLDHHRPQTDLVVGRSLSLSRNIAALACFERYGIAALNPTAVISLCGDKLRTSLALKRAGVAQPRLKVAFTPTSALEAIETMGYPVVLKPIQGSWGRLIAKINDRDTAEAVLEHKATLGQVQHSIFYIQEFIPKGGRDIRAFVIGGETVAAIYREGTHWKTNTALGARALACEVSDELSDISCRAAAAVGGGILAIDIFESSRGLLVNEINATMEFKNSIQTTGIDIPARMVDYMVQAFQTEVAIA